MKRLEIISIMKKIISVMMLFVAISSTLLLSSCSDKDDSVPIVWPSTVLYERIAGKWMLTGFIGRDVSADSTYYIFTADGKILLDSKPNSQQGGIIVDMDSDTKVTFEFFNPWAVYNEATDEFEGDIILRLYNEQGEKIWGEYYNLIIGRTSMMFYYKVGPNENPGPIDTRRYVFERH